MARQLYTLYQTNKNKDTEFKRKERKWHLTYESYTVKMWILQLSYNQTYYYYYH